MLITSTQDPCFNLYMESLPSSRYLICWGWALNSQVVIASWVSAISNSRSANQTIYNQLQWDETLATTYDLGWCSTLNPATHPTVPPHPVATSCGSRARWPSAASLICSSKILWQGQCFRSQWNFGLWFRHIRWTLIISYQCTTISCNIMGRCVTITSTQAASCHYLHMIRFKKEKKACGYQKKISAMPCYQQPITTSILQGFHTSKFLGWQESNLDLQGSQICVNIFVDSLMVLKWTSECSKWWLCLAFMHTNTPTKKYLVQGCFKKYKWENAYDAQFHMIKCHFFRGQKSERESDLQHHWGCLSIGWLWIMLLLQAWKLCPGKCAIFTIPNLRAKPMMGSRTSVKIPLVYSSWSQNDRATHLSSSKRWLSCPKLERNSPPFWKKQLCRLGTYAYSRIRLVHFQLDPLLWRNHQANKTNHGWFMQEQHAA